MFGLNEPGNLRIMATTFKEGDPGYAGVLGGVALGLPSYHIFELKEEIPAEVWENLSTVAAMKQAGIEMGTRSFFTDMLRIVDLVPVPVLNDALADQYSEGCFAT